MLFCVPWEIPALEWTLMSLGEQVLLFSNPVALSGFVIPTIASASNASISSCAQQGLNLPQLPQLFWATLPSS